MLVGFLIMVALLFLVVVLLHAFDELFHLDVRAHLFHKIDHDHIAVNRFLERILHPFVGLASHIDEHITGCDFHDVRSCGLEAVQIHTAVEQERELHSIILSDHFSCPVIQREDCRHHADLLIFGHSASEQERYRQYKHGP